MLASAFRYVKVPDVRSTISIKFSEKIGICKAKSAQISRTQNFQQISFCLHIQIDEKPIKYKVCGSDLSRTSSGTKITQIQPSGCHPSYSYDLELCPTKKLDTAGWMTRENLLAWIYLSNTSVTLWMIEKLWDDKLDPLFFYQLKV